MLCKWDGCGINISPYSDNYCETHRREYTRQDLKEFDVRPIWYDIDNEEDPPN